MRVRVSSSMLWLKKYADDNQDPAVQKAVGSNDPIHVMQKLREMKNASWAWFTLEMAKLFWFSLSNALPDTTSLFPASAPPFAGLNSILGTQILFHNCSTDHNDSTQSQCILFHNCFHSHNYYLETQKFESSSGSCMKLGMWIVLDIKLSTSLLPFICWDLEMWIVQCEDGVYVRINQVREILEAKHANRPTSTSILNTFPP